MYKKELVRHGAPVRFGLGFELQTTVGNRHLAKHIVKCQNCRIIGGTRPSPFGSVRRALYELPSRTTKAVFVVGDPSFRPRQLKKMEKVSRSLGIEGERKSTHLKCRWVT
jgi:hypothetical protein